MTAPPPPPFPGEEPSVAKPKPTPVVYDHAVSTWGLGDMVASLAVYFLGSLALIFGIYAIVDNNDFLEGPWLLVGVVGPHVLLLTHVRWVSRSKGQGLATEFGLRMQRPDGSLGIGLFVAALVGAGIIAAIVTRLSGTTPTSTAVELAQTSASDGLTIWLYLFAFFGATLIPVVEELVYRGLFWGALEKRGVPPWVILFVTSLVFAMVHLEPARTPVLFAVGFAIGLGRLLTGRIGASIVAHMMINALALMATLAELSD